MDVSMPFSARRAQNSASVYRPPAPRLFPANTFVVSPPARGQTCRLALRQRNVAAVSKWCHVSPALSEYGMIWGRQPVWPSGKALSW